ncbi:MAG: tRNA (adenosine(37)-N6)-threonylcarbamoyltransferase complex dimerization subunit type 1 TsaB [Clostridia bacterium]
MNILAIDTTTKSACVAIQKNKKITEESVTNEITHSEKLLPLINKMLKETKLTLDDISKLVCINGPGSFTGIRIGLATLKAFAQVKNLNIFTMTSLEALAISTYMKNNTHDTQYILSLIDSRNDRVYYALYKIYEIDKKIVSDIILNISNDEILDALNKVKVYLENNTFNITGDCIVKYNDNITSIFNNAKITNNYPTASILIQAIDKLYNTDRYIFDAYTLDAIYARPSQAERMKSLNEQ